MENKSKRAGSAAAITPCHGAYLEFLNALLAYLRDAESSEEQQRQDLGKIENLANRLRRELSLCTPKGETRVQQQLDEVVRLTKEYYPSEGDSPELSQAVEALSKTMQRQYGIT
jgi:hypothetical protein